LFGSGEVHSLRELRDLLPHRLELAQDLLPFGRLHARPAMLARDPLGDGGSDRAQHPERAAEKHEGGDGFRPIHSCDFFANSRSVKSTRSLSSEISNRVCCSSASRSSRSACNSSLTVESRARGRIRSAKARMKGKRMMTAPATTAIRAKSDPLSIASAPAEAAQLPAAWR